MKPTRHVPVLIVGGGPVGLALAGELGWRGIACELVEQSDGVITTPKMNEVNTRTMEFCRRWGIAEAVRNCPFPADHPLDVVFVTSMSGHELARMRRPSRARQHAGDDSPEHLQICSQLWFDPMLQAFAGSQPTVKLRYRTRLAGFDASADGVAAQLHDLESGRSETISADYLVGCDGASSEVREALGVPMQGKGALGYPLHLYFRAPDLFARCGREPGVFFLTIDRGGMWANVRFIDPANDLWRLMVLDSGGRQTPETVDRAALLERAIGRPFEVEWKGLSIWTRRSVVAEHYGKGRVFLAGDAVHQLSPTGALGMNTGIGDAVDLGWKLAAVLQGWGGGKLLDAYEAERRPVGLRNVRTATEFYFSLGEPDADAAAIEDDSAAGRLLRERLGESLTKNVGRMFRTMGMQLGYRYDSSPICVGDGVGPPDDPERYVPSAHPGSRAPHCWLRDGRSILDLFGRGFVLLRFAAAPTTALEQAALARGVPLTVVDRDEPEAIALYERCLVLVRPDGHVAWRGDAVPADAAALIDRVRGAI
ncbi:MAG TPA: FAD-dependent monooxygenase [Xanthobacteraceae bacterium]|nr:FAD-dependent monooxygenase [Xanthobacteraceae bacterium]